MILKNIYAEIARNRRKSKIRKEIREESIVIMSNVLKDILTGKYECYPPFIEVKESDKLSYKAVAVRGLMNGMNELDKGLHLPKSLKHAHVMYRSDLERYGYSFGSNATIMKDLMEVKRMKSELESEKNEETTNEKKECSPPLTEEEKAIKEIIDWLASL